MWHYHTTLIHIENGMSVVILKSRLNIFGSHRQIELLKSGVKIVADGKETTLDYGSVIKACHIQRKILGHTVVICTFDSEYQVEGLSHLNCLAQVEELNSRAAIAISQYMIHSHKKFFDQVRKVYLRESQIPHLQRIQEPVVRLLEQLQNKNSDNLGISSEVLALANELVSKYPLQKHKNELREDYINTILEQRSSFYDQVEKNKLTQLQRRAVIIEDDFNLVLAAAGTGKTSVMVAKAIDLIERGLAKEDEILILAFGQKAKEELQTRSKERLKSIGLEHCLHEQISTFHKRGLDLVKSHSELSNSIDKDNLISPLAKFPEEKDRYICKWLTRFIRHSSKTRSIFLNTIYHAYDPFTSASDREHKQVLGQQKYRTLDGNYVRGYQEVLIGNWLFINGIDYEYEVNYCVQEDVSLGFPYHPDFYIKSGDIQVYLEHFGIDRKERTRADINSKKYNADIEKKRKWHEKFGTVLIETFHYDWTEGNLEKRLNEQLQQKGIFPNPIDMDTFESVVRDAKLIDSSVKRLGDALSVVRSEGIEGKEIHSRIKAYGINENEARCHYELIERLRAAYIKTLRDTAQLDFDDMILEAQKLMSRDKFTPPWKYILVDEFQDISRSRWNLLKSFVDYGSDVSLTVVGDDWQSIYSFGGGKLTLTTRWEKEVGRYALVNLDKTFRYTRNIADVAGNFVMKNKEQFVKHIETHDKSENNTVFIMDDLVNGESDQVGAIKPLINKLLLNNPSLEIGILSRFRATEKDAKTKLKQFKNVKYWTVHQSKGLEADVCFVLDLNSTYMGFPSVRAENAVVEALRENEDKYLNAEERRLLYVAITRAKQESYLVASALEPSEFILEILSGDYEVDVISDLLSPEHLSKRACPNCKVGLFKPRYNWPGMYDCSVGTSCGTEALQCEKCTGLAVKAEKYAYCLNNECGHRFRLCPQCSSVLLTRNLKSKKGVFIGCDNFKKQDEKKKCRFKDFKTLSGRLDLKADQRIKC
ncbi:UvrD-helicase domain-containing protein [Vibrio splendidus]